jgi:hypothetical protein
MKFQYVINEKCLYLVSNQYAILLVSKLEISNACDIITS